MFKMRLEKPAMKGPFKRTHWVDSFIKSASTEVVSFHCILKDSADPQNGPF